MDAVVQLFANPRSGSYSPRRIAALVRAFEAAGADVIESEASADHPPAIDRRATHVCVAGGDGTVRHVARALGASGHAAPLAQYPLGTINLVAREAAYHPDPMRFAERFLGTGKRRRHYTGALADEMFLVCASAGPEVAAIRGYSPILKRRLGRLAYGVSMLRALADWQRHPLTVTADGQTIACEAVYIAKGRFFAGPFSFAPKASLTDGKLHVVTLGTARRRDYLRFLADLVRHRDPGLRPGNRSFVCTELSIDGPAHVEVQADGDIVASLPLRASASAEPIEFV
ncbi:diacylglycerol/lipid kinase family protein [Tsuneonella sp. HG222]